jgi:hypothetical protein
LFVANDQEPWFTKRHIQKKLRTEESFELKVKWLCIDHVSQYELSIPDHSDQFDLLSNDPKDLEWGFSKTLDNEKRFRKDVTLWELDWVFEQETTVKYKGDEFTADHIVGKYIMLQTNDQGLSVKHKMEEWKHGGFRLPVDMKDVEEIVIKWTPLREYYSYK